MESNLERDFYEVRNLIRSLAKRFANSKGGDYEELYAEGCFQFVRLYEKYDPDRGVKLSTWLHKVLWRRFCSLYRGERRRQPGERVPEEELVARRNGSVKVRRTLEGLGPKAVEVLDVVLCPPPDVALEHRRAVRAPHGYRRALKELLVGLGWTPEEIMKAFNEIARAVSES